MCVSGFLWSPNTWARWKSGSGGSFWSLLDVTSRRLSFCSREKVPSGMKSSMLWSKLSVWRLVIFCTKQRQIAKCKINNWIQRLRKASCSCTSVLTVLQTFLSACFRRPDLLWLNENVLNWNSPQLKTACLMNGKNEWIVLESCLIKCSQVKDWNATVIRKRLEVKAFWPGWPPTESSPGYCSWGPAPPAPAGHWRLPGGSSPAGCCSEWGGGASTCHWRCRCLSSSGDCCKGRGGTDWSTCPLLINAACSGQTASRIRRYLLRCRALRFSRSAKA